MRRKIATRLGLALATVLTLSGIAIAPAQAESESNNTLKQASPIDVGVSNAQRSAISPAGDVDFYKVTVPRGGVYTVQVHNVDPSVGSLKLTTYGSNGLSYDSREWNGVGDVLATVELSPSTSGTVFFAVRGMDGHTGRYSVRILPPYDQQPVFDAQGEPSDTRATSRRIEIGRSGQISAALQPSNPAYLTANTDRDFYWFDAPRDGVYTIEAFNVDSTLSDITIKRYGSNGLLFDTSNKGTGVTAARLTYNASAGRIFFSISNGVNQTGRYAVRVLPPYSQGLTWDSSQEPNDTKSTSAPAVLGRQIDSTLATLPKKIATDTPDVDRYHVTLAAGKSYTFSASSPSVRLYLGISAMSSWTSDSTTCAVGELCQITFTPSDTDVYYLTVDHEENSLPTMGAYRACAAVTGSVCQPATGFRNRVGAAPAATNRIGEATGDRLADIWGIDPKGNLNFHQYAAGKLGPGQLRGTGLTNISYIGAITDQNGDRRADLFYRDRRDNSLWFAYNQGNGYLVAGKKIGQNWGGMDQIWYAGTMVAGSPQQHVLARRKSDGSLWRYNLDATGLNHGTQVGRNWNGMRIMLSPGNMTGDTAWDVIGIRTDGLLFRYRSYNGGKLVLDKEIGHGWTSFPTAFSPGDITNDGRLDLIGKRSDGTLWAYANTANGFSTIGQIGSGFGGYRLMA